MVMLMSMHDAFYTDEEILDEEKNEYLANPKKGLELIASILKKSREEKKNFKWVRVFNLFNDSLKAINIDNEIRLAQRFKTLIKKQMQRTGFLGGKTIIGVGGQYSSGKSAFINSVLRGEELSLPENQNPTTAIATYLVKNPADQQKIEVFNKQNHQFSIDLQGLNALTHEFSETYAIGFSNMIQHIKISTIHFQYNKIALLDTPGYSKPDQTKRKETKDSSKAFEQLRTADYLIWLIDAENGTAVSKDIEFLKKIEIQSPILFVLTKVYKKKSSIHSVLHSTKNTLKKYQFNIFDVIIHSKHGYEEDDSPKFIKLLKDGIKTRKAFFEMAEKKVETSQAILNKMQSILSEIIRDIDKQKDSFNEENRKIRKLILESEDLLAIKSLAKLHSQNIKELSAYEESKRVLQRKITLYKNDKED